jgi:tetratricopeptide (TPR) repeat protein
MKFKVAQFILVIFIVAGCNDRQKIADLTTQAAEAMANENYEQAIKDYSEVIQLAPQDAPAYTARGDAFVILGKFEEGIQDFNEAIRLDPKNYLAYQLRGTAYYGDHQFDKAISDLDFTLEHQSDDAITSKLRGDAFKLRGTAYFWKNSFTNTIADLTQASKYLPDDYEIYEIRGACYDRRTDADKALSDFNIAIQLNPEATRALYGRGRIYSHAGAYTNAIQDFEAVLKLRPQAVGAENLLAWLLATCPDDQIRDGKKAVELATKACDMTKWTNYAYVDTLAATYAETGDFDQAVKYQKQAASMDGITDDNRTNVQNRIELYLQHKPYRMSKTPNAYD